MSLFIKNLFHRAFSFEKPWGTDFFSIEYRCQKKQETCEDHVFHMIFVTNVSIVTSDFSILSLEKTSQSYRTFCYQKIKIFFYSFCFFGRCLVPRYIFSQIKLIKGAFTLSFKRMAASKPTYSISSLYSNFSHKDIVSETLEYKLGFFPFDKTPWRTLSVCFLENTWHSEFARGQ